MVENIEFRTAIKWSSSHADIVVLKQWSKISITHMKATCHWYQLPRQEQQGTFNILTFEAKYSLKQQVKRILICFRKRCTCKSV